MARGPLRIARDGQLQRIKRPGPGTLDFALRTIRGGKRRIMEELAPFAIEFEPRLVAAVQRWTELTRWRRRFVTLDDLAEGAGLTRGEFVAAIARASFEFTGSMTDLIVAAALPAMVATSVKRALTPDGFEDRLLLLDHMGFFEDPNPRRSSSSNQQPSG